jgi:hypothetical protein
MAHNTKPKIPMISFFCQPTSDLNHAKSDEPAEAQAMTSVLYGLIRHLIELLPLEIETRADLSSIRFACLDGNQGSWEAVLQVLRDLIKLFDRPIFCVLDGIHWLEHQTTECCLKRLVGELQQEPVHVLFITTGSSSSLRPIVHKNSTINEENGRAGEAKEDLMRHRGEFWR